MAKNCLHNPIERRKPGLSTAISHRSFAYSDFPGTDRGDAGNSVILLCNYGRNFSTENSFDL